MVVLNLIIGTVTPPVGFVLFVVTRIAEIRFEVMARAILPWLVRCGWCWRRSRCIRN